MKLKEAREAINTHVKDLIELCPHCGAKAHIEALWNECHKLRNGDVEFYVIFRCKPCRQLILKTFALEQNRYTNDEQLAIKGWDEMFPVSLDDQLNKEEKEFIPSDILVDYQEALKCKAIAANRAGCAMFRRSLQGALVNLGADVKLDLIKQIDSLENLPKDIKDWAHQIRIFGNWGAHPDKDNLKDVDSNDLAEAHDFMSKFLLYMFIMPEKVKLSREKREKKASGGAGSNGGQAKKNS
jgi:hypothetical protein